MTTQVLRLHGGEGCRGSTKVYYPSNEDEKQQIIDAHPSACVSDGGFECKKIKRCKTQQHHNRGFIWNLLHNK